MKDQKKKNISIHHPI